MNNTWLRKSILLSLLVFITIGWGFLFYQDREPVTVPPDKDTLIRFHVLANSDSPADQQLKLKVRDGIIAYLEPYFENITTKDVAKQIILEHKHQLIAVAQQIVTTNGADYPIDIQLGVFDFPMKSYGDLLLPAGKYEAVRVLIGQGEGKNWWCVLFPPLCFIDITNATATPLKVITTGNEQQPIAIEFKSKIAELWRANQN